MANFPPVMHLNLRISTRNLEKNLNDPDVIFRGCGEYDTWKKTWSNKSPVTLPLKQHTPNKLYIRSTARNLVTLCCVERWKSQRTKFQKGKATDFYRLLKPCPGVWFSFWKSQTFGKNLKTFVSRFFFLSFFKIHRLVWIFLRIFRCFVSISSMFHLICSNIHFITCCFIQDSAVTRQRTKSRDFRQNYLCDFQLWTRIPVWRREDRGRTSVGRRTSCPVWCVRWDPASRTGLCAPSKKIIIISSAESTVKNLLWNC